MFAAAVGFAVRVTSPDQAAGTLVTAGILDAVGTPTLFVTGSDPGSFGAAILASFGSTYLVVDAALAAIVAVICAGWGKR
jgi:putative exporter of polyketide antibiotics